MGPSWVDFPFTVKVTPLGALDLTSMLAGATNVSQHIPSLKCTKVIAAIEVLTRAGVVEILVEELHQESLVQHPAEVIRRCKDFGMLTSLAALAMSEKAAGAAIVDDRWYEIGRVYVFRRTCCCDAVKRRRKELGWGWKEKARNNSQEPVGGKQTERESRATGQPAMAVIG